MYSIMQFLLENRGGLTGQNDVQFEHTSDSKSSTSIHFLTIITNKKIFRNTCCGNAVGPDGTQREKISLYRQNNYLRQRPHFYWLHLVTPSPRLGIRTSFRDTERKHKELNCKRSNKIVKGWQRKLNDPFGKCAVIPSLLPSYVLLVCFSFFVNKFYFPDATD